MSDENFTENNFKDLINFKISEDRKKEIIESLKKEREERIEKIKLNFHPEFDYPRPISDSYEEPKDSFDINGIKDPNEIMEEDCCPDQDVEESQNANEQEIMNTNSENYINIEEEFECSNRSMNKVQNSFSKSKENYSSNLIQNQKKISSENNESPIYSLKQ